MFGPSVGVWRAGRSENDLKHPNNKAVASDDTHGDHGPDQDRQNEEREQFLAPSAARHSILEI